MSRRDFYLVQRLDRRDNAARGGFDSLFGCQYMGAAEFEYGALPASLKRIRAAGRKLVVHEGEVTRKGVTKPVFVVGARKVAETIPDRLTAWMVDTYPFGHGRSFFPELVDGTAGDYMHADAWWALNEDVMWALDLTIADDLLRAVKA